MGFFGLRLLFAAWVALALCLRPAAAQPILYSHGDPTSFEQYMLELVNAARANPGAEALRLGIDLNQGLAPGTIANTAKHPLAIHPLLLSAARGHSDWMLATGVFSHTGVDGTTPTKRAERAGYPFGVAENIAFRSTNRPPDYALMTRVIHESLVKSFSHRVNIMGESFGVVGIGLRPGLFEGFNAYMGTQNFADGGASVDSGPFIVGVCYDDADGDNAYDPGEGVGSVRVDTSLGAYYAITSASGGYAIPIVPQTTNADTVNVPFAVQGAPWSSIAPYDADFRAAKIAAAASTNVQVVWSGGPLSGPITNAVSLSRPVRINYRLSGTDGLFYDRTMVTAFNTKVDWKLGSEPAPVSASGASVAVIPESRTVKAGKTARSVKFMVAISNNSTADLPVTVALSAAPLGMVTVEPPSIAITVPGKKSAKHKARVLRRMFTVFVPPTASGAVSVSAAVVGGSDAPDVSTLNIRAASR